MRTFYYVPNDIIQLGLFCEKSKKSSKISRKGLLTAARCCLKFTYCQCLEFQPKYLR